MTEKFMQSLNGLLIYVGKSGGETFYNVYTPQRYLLFTASMLNHAIAFCSTTKAYLAESGYKAEEEQAITRVLCASKQNTRYVYELLGRRAILTNIRGIQHTGYYFEVSMEDTFETDYMRELFQDYEVAKRVRKTSVPSFCFKFRTDGTLDLDTAFVTYVFDLTMLVEQEIINTKLLDISITALVKHENAFQYLMQLFANKGLMTKKDADLLCRLAERKGE